MIYVTSDGKEGCDNNDNSIDKYLTILNYLNYEFATFVMQSCMIR